jgi:hypothetical protein
MTPQLFTTTDININATFLYIIILSLYNIILYMCYQKKEFLLYPVYRNPNFYLTASTSNLSFYLFSITIAYVGIPIDHIIKPGNAQ